MEEWRDVTGYEGYYMVSSNGKVKSLDRAVTRNDGVEIVVKGKDMTTYKARNGYMMVDLSYDGITKKKLVHRLVAMAFIENSNGQDEVNHKNHIRSDNRVSNLEWCSHLGNMVDSVLFHNGNYKDSHNENSTNKCVDCGKDVMYKSIRCRQCEGKYRAVNNKDAVKKESLVESLNRNNGNFTRASKEFGMTDNALRKWCRKYGFPTHSKEWKQGGNN